MLPKTGRDHVFAIRAARGFAGGASGVSVWGSVNGFPAWISTSEPARCDGLAVHVPARRRLHSIPLRMFFCMEGAMLRPMSGTRFCNGDGDGDLGRGCGARPVTLAEAYAQTSVGPARPMITQQVVETNAVRLVGNTRPEAIAANDRGRVPDNLAMEHLLLQLRRPPAQEQALNQLIDQLHNPASAKFHQWLKPSEFGAQFGPAASDIAQITAWLG